MAQVDVYLDDFIPTFQGIPTKRRQSLNQLFRSIEKFFIPNVDTNGLHNEPISTKNLRQGEIAWSTNETVLGWDLNTL